MNVLLALRVKAARGRRRHRDGCGRDGERVDCKVGKGEGLRPRRPPHDGVWQADLAGICRGKHDESRQCCAGIGAHDRKRPCVRCGAIAVRRQRRERNAARGTRLRVRRQTAEAEHHSVRLALGRGERHKLHFGRLRQ